MAGGGWRVAGERFFGMPIVAEQISRYTAQVSGYGAVDKAASSTERLAKAQAKAKSNFVFKATGGGAAGNQSIISKIAKSASGGGSEASGMLGGVVEAASGVVSTVTNAMSFVAGSVAKGLTSIVSTATSIIPGIGQVFSAITSVAGQAFSTILQGAGELASGIISAIGKAAVVVGGILGTMAAGFLSFAMAASSAAAEMEALRMGLAAVTGSAAEAEAQLKRLEVVAEMPGLGFKEAIQGSLRLQSAGFSARMAEAALVGFGNAVARAGNGKAELDGVTLALMQISQEGKVTKDNLDQIGNRAPEVRKAMQAAFGTSNTEALMKMGVGAKEFVARVTEELLKMPRVMGGMKNASENLEDAWFRLKASAGQVFNDFLAPVISMVADVMGKLVKSGVMKQISEGFMSMFGAVSKEGVTNVIATVAAVLMNLPSMIKAVGEVIGVVVEGAVKGVKSAFDFILPILNMVAKATGLLITQIADMVLSFISTLGPVIAALVPDDMLKGLQKVAQAGGFLAKNGTGVTSSAELGGAGEGFFKKLMDGPAGKGLQDAWGKISEDRDSIKRRMAGAATGKSDPIADAKASVAAEIAAGFTRGTEGDGVLGEIAANTATTAKNTNPDLKRHGLGGNDLGRIISPAELQGMRAQVQNRNSVQVNVNDEDIRRFVEKISFQVLGSLSTGGYHLQKSH